MIICLAFWGGIFLCCLLLVCDTPDTSDVRFSLLPWVWWGGDSDRQGSIVIVACNGEEVSPRDPCKDAPGWVWLQEMMKLITNKNLHQAPFRNKHKHEIVVFRLFRLSSRAIISIYSCSRHDRLFYSTFSSLWELLFQFFHLEYPTISHIILISW